MRLTGKAIDRVLQEAGRRDPLVMRSRLKIEDRASKYIPHTPTPKQAEYLTYYDREGMYGGAAGGGKSDALLMAGLQFVHYPDYAGILFRRKLTDLERAGGLIDRSLKWLSGTDATYLERRKTWVFPSGATLGFGYIDNDSDLENYYSNEFQFIGFDELTQFREKWYRFMFSRLRRGAGSRIPLRMRSATNPGSQGHAWVKQRFIIEQVLGRKFFPAKLEDNPYLDREEYVKSLQELDPVLLQQLLNGDWDVALAGALFQRAWFTGPDAQIMRAAMPLTIKKWVRVWDLAASPVTLDNPDPDWTVGTLVAWDGLRFYIVDIQRVRKLPGDVEKLVIETAKRDGQKVAVRIEQEPGASGKAEAHRLISSLPGYDVEAFKPEKSKEDRARPASSQAKIGNIVLVIGPWITAFLDELEAFPYGAHDDIVDTISGAVNLIGEMKSKGIVSF